MVRARWAVLVAAASLGLSAGCSSLCNHPLFGKRSDACCPGSGCCEGYEGTCMGETGPMMIPPGTQPAVVAPSMPPPQTTVPPLAPPPRLVPQPMSRVTPYYPQ
jgi:hypothetical protein